MSGPDVARSLRWRVPETSARAAESPGLAKNCMSVVEPRREFVDSNILVYAFDHAAGRKSETARSLLRELWNSGAGCLSVQVLQEFFVSVTRKVARPMALRDAAREVEDLSGWRVHVPSPRDLLAAIDLQESLPVSSWDAMIVHSARELRCRTLWTEDLDDGQTYAGVLARDPFTRS